jgi:predicted RNase H-like HicB family nuclease
MSAKEFIVRVHHEEGGSIWGEVLDLPGCFASGDSLDEFWEALEEAISLYLHDEPGLGRIEGKDKLSPEPPESRPRMEVGEMRVKVPA